jgi:hypothetical protein
MRCADKTTPSFKAQNDSGVCACVADTELGVVFLLKDEITAISGKQNTSVKFWSRAVKKRH